MHVKIIIFIVKSVVFIEYIHVFSGGKVELVTILSNGKTGEAYNISNPKSIITIRELAELFAKKSGQSIVFENPTNIENKSFNMMDYSVLQADKLLSLGWFGHFTPAKGVDATLKYYRKQR